jgi:hypothetical protein
MVMNDKIKQLWEKAATASAAYPSGQNNSWETQVNFMEKFAELIVKECMEQVWYTREDGINGNVSQVIKDRIKQHFGVK